MKLIRSVELLILTAGLVAATSAGAEQQQLTIASAGGAWQQAQHNAWYAPFAQKMGIKFNEEETSAGMARVEAMVKAHNVTDDVVTVDTAEVLSACRLGRSASARLGQDCAARRLSAGGSARLRNGAGCLRRHSRLQHRCGEERRAHFGARFV